ncbi:MAG: MCP four helix bundle domain-containing protein [Pirellulales bacterium]|nr:MCP four helix bundle domain-containing protein [Pirellulales bacterium]
MRYSLAQRISLSVGSVVLLAAVSSVVALASTWHIRRLLDKAVTENLASVRAAEELEIAVLDQRGYVAFHLLDHDNPTWLDELRKREKGFSDRLDNARRTTNSDEERDILNHLESMYRQYDDARKEVLRLCGSGDIDAAQKLLVGKVNRLHDETYKLCESFLDANEAQVELAARNAGRESRLVTWAVACFVFLTFVFGAVLLLLFFRGIVFPLRAMAADAREFIGEPGSDGNTLPTNELRTIGGYLQSLMSDVVDSRTVLEQHRHRLRSAEKLASVGKLAASVAHEVRNPLTAIKMWLFSIQKDVGGDEALDRKFRIVSEEIRRLENIVRDFLDFSRPRELAASKVSVADFLDGILELIRPRMASEQIVLQHEFAHNLPDVLIDPEQMKQVLLNLINNAADATGKGGRIAVTAAPHTADSGEPMVVVRISDNGGGIPDEVVRRLYEPFFSTKEQGTGLGLSIAAQIVARHLGRLVLESTGPEGTTFAVHIPVARK